MPNTTSVLPPRQSTRSRIQTVKSTSTKSPGRLEPDWRRALPASRLQLCWLGYWHCLRKWRSIPARQTCDCAQTATPASRAACESYSVNTSILLRGEKDAGNLYPCTNSMLPPKYVVWSTLFSKSWVVGQHAPSHHITPQNRGERENLQCRSPCWGRNWARGFCCPTPIGNSCADCAATPPASDFHAPPCLHRRLYFPTS